MIISKQLINDYLSQIHSLIKRGRYRIEKNINRQKNINFYVKYKLTDKVVEGIILSLEATNFSNIVHNKKHGFEHELLYIFGKDVKLENINGYDEIVPVYVKINKIDDYFVVIISIHEQEKPLDFPFCENKEKNYE